MTGNEFCEYLETSAELYGFLAQVLFKELTADAIEGLAAGDWSAKDTGNANLDLGYRYLRRYFRFSAGDRRTQLACEYARVFLAAGVHKEGKHTAVPYESVFTSAEHTMMADSRDDLVRRFAQDGFQVDPSLHEPEDHLSFELEYLSTMSSRALPLLEDEDADALHANIKRQLEMIDGHVLNWLPALIRHAEGFAQLSFYLGILYLALGSLEMSREVLIDVRTHGLQDDACAAGADAAGGDSDGS